MNASKIIDYIKSKKHNINFIIIALIHYVITFFTDHLIFNFEELNIGHYVFCKIILLIILLAFWNFFAKLFVDENKFGKKYLKNLLIYLIPIIIILLLIWPGVWLGSDNKNFFNYAINGNYFYQLNYLTSIFYIVAYMIFPCPSGAIILQTILMGGVASYIVTKTQELTKNNKKAYIMYIPFFILHTIFYTFYANRPVIVGILYLLLIAILVFDKINKNKLSTKKLVVFILLIALLTNWRKEQFYLALICPIIIFITYKVKLNIKNIAKILIPVYLASIIVYIPQSLAYQDKIASYKRNLPTYITPLSCMLNMELRGEELEEALNKIDKVVDIEICTQYYSYGDCAPMYQEGWLRDFTVQDYEEFLEGYRYIILNNIDKFLYTKLITFAQATTIKGDGFSSIELYTDDEDTLYRNRYKIFKSNF